MNIGKTKVKLFGKTAKVPLQAHDNDSGYDLFVNRIEKIPAENGTKYRCFFGVGVMPPKGYFFEVVPRSSFSKLGFSMQHGIIDADFTGEIFSVITAETSPAAELPAVNDRIAQLILRPLLHTTFELAEELDKTFRGENGFGSSGR
ncbi:MAG: hypothetical protein LBH47_01350 [Christensenellaceae bacterium]|nr:hypothetical protein [Christensenellaceae bacterium]